jgi:ELWxxDGT repeat protein
MRAIWLVAGVAAGVLVVFLLAKATPLAHAVDAEHCSACSHGSHREPGTTEAPPRGRHRTEVVCLDQTTFRPEYKFRPHHCIFHKRHSPNAEAFFLRTSHNRWKVWHFGHARGKGNHQPSMGGPTPVRIRLFHPVRRCGHRVFAKGHFRFPELHHGTTIALDTCASPTARLVKSFGDRLNPLAPLEDLTRLGGELYFTVDDGTRTGELWKSDGTATGTRLVTGIRRGTVEGDAPFRFEVTRVADKLYFRAADPTHGTELWRSDGTAAGTKLVKDIYPGGFDSSPEDLENVAGTLYFTADDPRHGTELWTSDGTAAGTKLVKDIHPGVGGSSPPYSGNLTEAAGRLWFSADDGNHGFELWKSNGTTAGTKLVKDIYPGPGSSEPSLFTNLARKVFFRATDARHGTELWKSNGTAAGTKLVKDIDPRPDGSQPRELTNVAGRLYFSAGDPPHGWELWKSNGTAAGTKLVKDIRRGGANSFPSSLTKFAGKLYFSAADRTHGAELWKSDGTTAGTRLVKDINPGGIDSFPGDLTSTAGTLYFTVIGPTGGPALWASDGTAAGTKAVNGTPSEGFDGLGNLTNVAGTLYFTADDGTNGWALWKVVP